MKNFLKNLALLLAQFATMCALAKDASFTPSNPPEMKRLASHDTAAFLTAAKFRRGVNLGNILESPPGQNWGGHADESDFVNIKAQGFDHVRLPVGWQNYAGSAPDFTINREIFQRVDFMVTNALKNGLGIIINIHNFDDFTSAPAANTEKFVKLWAQIAAHYSSAPETVLFELINEPKDAATTKVLNPIYPQVIAAIRSTNPRRTIVISPSKWGSIEELKNMVLPEDDANLLVTVHCYDPFFFTHQGAFWAGAGVSLTGIQFPGPPAKPLETNRNPPLPQWEMKRLNDYNTLPADKNPAGPIAFEGKLHYAHEWSDYYGRPVYVGEFGAYTKGDAVSRANFLRAFRTACEREKLGWALWDWNAGFRYWNRRTGSPEPGLHEALFGK